MSTVSATCDGSASRTLADGSLLVTARGGWGGYTLLLGDEPVTLRSDNTYALGGLRAGSYNFTLVDEEGCEYRRSVSVGADYCRNFAIEVLTTRNPCVGGSNGQATLARRDACGFPITYTWDDGDTSSVRRNLTTGEHTVTARTENGCSVARTITLGTLPTPRLACTAVQTTGPTGRDGSIRIEIQGGARPLTVLLDGEEIGTVADEEFNTTYVARGLPVGAYTLRLVGANGCGSSCTSEVTSRPCVVTLASSTFTDRLSCFSDSDGGIRAEATGGVEPYTYTWQDGATGPTRQGLVAGSYTVDVVDDSGCTDRRTFTITEPALLEASAARSGLLCGAGAPDGRIEVTAVGGTQPYSYTWSHRSDLDTSVATRLNTGTYTATVTDARGCSASASRSFSRPDTIGIEITAVRGSGNPGLTTLTATAFGGTGTLRFRWLGSERDGPVRVVSSVRRNNYTYTVRVTDANGCTKDASYSVVPPPPLSAEVADGSVRCFDDRDGVVSVQIGGGIPGYRYGWRRVDGDGTELSNGSRLVGPAGDYRVLVTDAAGSDTTLFATIVRSEQRLGIAATVEPASCEQPSSGSISLRPRGGWGGYSFTLNEQELEIGEDGAYARAGLRAGTYAAVVTDRRGCSVLDSITVGDDGCTGFAVSAQSISPACADEGTGAIRLPANDICGDSILYVWADGGERGRSRTGLVAGSYIVTARRSSNPACAVRDTFVVPRAPAVSLVCEPTQTTGPTASDGTVTLTIGGPEGEYRLLLDGELLTTTEGREYTLRNLATGTYRFTAVGPAGCQSSCSAEVTQRPCSVSLDSSAYTERLACFGDDNGFIRVEARGGVEPYIYSWQDGSTDPVRNNLGAGIYVADVIDASGCTNQRTFTITEPTLLEATLESSGLRCGGGAPDGRIEVAAQGGSQPYRYRWSHRTDLDTAVATGLRAGDYTVTVTDANDCSVTLGASFAQLDTIAIAITAVRNPDAPRLTTLTATATGGTGELTFRWLESEREGPTNVVSSLRRTDYTYTVRVTDANGCAAEASYDVTPPPPFTAEVTDGGVRCYDDRDGEASVVIGGGIPAYTYAWRPVDGDGAELSTGPRLVGPAGEYRVLVTDAAGSDTTLFAAIVRPDQRLGLETTVQPASCEVPTSGSISLRPRGGWGGYRFTLNEQELEVDDEGNYAREGLRAGTYAAVVTDERGCSVLDSITVGNDGCTGFAVSALSIAPACADDASGVIELPATDVCGDSIIYFWDDAPNAGRLRTGLAARSYTVTAARSSNSSCTVRDTFAVPQAPAVTLVCEPTETAGPTATDGAVTLRIDGPAGTYRLFFDGDSLAATENREYIVRGLAAGTYTFTAIGPAGCRATCTAEVTARPCALDVDASVASPAVSCVGETDGFIRTAANNGVGELTFAWADSSAAVPFRENLSPGAYTVTVSDAVGCEVTRTFDIGEPDTLRADIVARIDSTNFTTTLRAVVAGGTPGFTYAWSGGRSGASIEVPFGRAARYVLTVTDSSGCTASARYDYLPDGELRLTLEAKDLSCFGADDGRVVATPRGGIPPYTYVWNGAAEATSDSLLTQLAPGTYTLSLFDGVGESVSAEAQVRGPETQLILDIQTTPAACAKTGPTGTLTLTVDGGWGAPLVTVNGSAVELDGGQFMLTDQSPGEYRVELVDRQGQGCEIARTVAIVPESCEAFTVSPTEIFRPCPGERTGGARFSASDDCGLPITYTWPDGRDTAARRDLPAGTYLVTATNSERCTYELRVDVVAAEPVVLTCSAEEATGPYSSDGVVTLDLSGGVGPFEVWRDSVLVTTVESGSYRDGARAVGTYTYEVRAANGCTTSCVSTVESCAQPFAELPLRVSTEPQGCAGPGGVVRVSGDDVAAYEYSLDTARTWTSNAELSDLPPGAYQLAVRSRRNPVCVFYTTTLTVAPDYARTVRVTEQTDPTTCAVNDGRISVEVPTAAMHLLLSLDGGTATSGSTLYEDLPAGRYRVTAEDTVSGCSKSFDLLLATPAAARIDAVATVASTDCFEPNGAIALTTAGATATTRYRIDGGAWQTASRFTDLAPGRYTVELRDSVSGCAFVWGESISLTGVPSVAAPRIRATDPSTCRAEDGAITLTGNLNGAVALETSFDGGASWSTNTQLTELPIGNYRLGIRTAGEAAGLCVRYDTVRLVDGFRPQVDSVVATDPWDCAIGAGTVRVNGATPGQLFSVDDGASWSATGSFGKLAAGNYQVLVAPRDTACPRPLRSLTLTERPAPPLTVDYQVADALDCEAETGEITVRNPEASVSYTLAGATGTSGAWANLSPGTFTLIAQDGAISCRVDTTRVEVSGLPALTLKLEDSRRPSCYAESDGFARLSAGGGDGSYSYALRDSIVGAEVSGLPAGLHEVIVIDGRGCSTGAVVDLPEVAQLARIDSFVEDLDRCGLRTASYDLSAYADSLALTWRRPDGTRVSGPLFETAVAGPHVLNVTAPDGCSFDKPFDVVLADVDAPALDVLAAETYAMGTGGFYLFEISDVAPDALVWTVDDPRVSIVAEDAISLQLEFSEPGEYTVEIGATFGDCDASVVRKVRVVDEPILEDDIVVGSIIQEMALYPNPHNGQFTVDVELNSAKPVYLEVINLDTRATVATRQLQGAKKYAGIRFELNDAGRAGRYLLVARTGSSVRVLRHLRF